MYHLTKIQYKKELLDQFIRSANSLRDEDPVMRLLPKLGEEIRIHVVNEERALLCGTLGNVYWGISKYWEKAENCKKAITAYEEALKVYTLQDSPMDYAMTQNNLGNAYRTLAEVEDKAKNCKKAITAYEEALKVYTLQDSPMDYAMTQNNLGNAYRTLAEVEDKAKNCKKAITAYEEALKVFTREKFPEPYKIVQKNVTRLLDFCKSRDVSSNS